MTGWAAQTENIQPD